MLKKLSLPAKTQLKKDYYLDNFEKLLDFVETRYFNLLTEQEKNFLKIFKNLPHNAKCLYVRLSSRKGPLFRKEKIEYEEITDLDEAVLFLIEKNLIKVLESTCELTAFQIDEINLLKLFTKADLEKYLYQNDNVKFNCKVKYKRKYNNRDELDQNCLSASHLLLELLTSNQILYPLYQEIVKRFFFIFFGNLEQTLSDFILEEIGNLRYEPYQLDPQDLYFNNRSIIDNSFEFLNKKILFYEYLERGESSDIKEARQILINLKGTIQDDDLLLKRWKKLHYRLGYAYERNKNFREAIACYEVTSSPPSRERKIRVLEKIGEKEEAKRLFLEMENNPIDCTEEEFINKRNKKIESYNFKLVKIKKIKNKNIEDLLLHHLEKEGYQGFFLENVLWNALFGLYFWDIIFKPIKGVFFNPFQRGPTDLFSSKEFYLNRKEEIEQRLHEIRNNERKNQATLDLYRSKYKTANFFVSWKAITEVELELVLKYVKNDNLANIFERMIQDLRKRSCGFPDLFVFNEQNNNYFLVEVKGPGDKLSPTQKEWMTFFQKKEIPYLVAKVEWLNE
ncbi:MAG: VRR-NUC domain-containing protein [Oligoflexia bacterium]|nr:VRR-NUC domain-containing protein [Oligoflexia bacterium]